MSYPIEVTDDEPIVRVVRTPYHLNRGRNKLTPSAFKPPSGSREVSVIRWKFTYPDANVLKGKVREIGGDAYAGVAELVARECRLAGANVVDSRQAFPGHADVVFPEAEQPHEPLEGNVANLSAAIRRKLADASKFFSDPEPESPDWTIPEILPPAPLEK